MPKIDHSPSLKRYLEESLETLYQRAVKDAIYETRLPRSRTDAIPAVCPWTLDELLEGEPE
jgi:hypothetical protein